MLIWAAKIQKMLIKKGTNKKKVNNLAEWTAVFGIWLTLFQKVLIACNTFFKILFR